MSAVIFTLWSLVVIGTAPDSPVVTGVATRDLPDMALCEAIAKDLNKHPSFRAKCFPK